MKRWTPIAPAVVTAAALAVAIVGCATPPPPGGVALDVEIPDSWSVDFATPRAESAPWWSDLGVGPVDTLIREALETNRNLDAATANVEAARAAATIAGADRFPQLNGSFQGSRAKQIFVGLPIPGGGVLSSQTNNFGLSAQASWEIDLWNRLGLRERAAVADLQAAEADLAAARLSISGLVARTFIALTELERQRALAERTVDAFRETLAIAEDRYDRGLISSVDVHLTRTQTENTAALLALRQNQLQTTARQLEVLLGRYPSGTLRVAAEFPRSVGEIPAGLPADLVLRRPDLLAAERRLVAAQARSGEARRNLLPRLTLTGSTGTTSNQLGDLLDGDFGVWSIAGSLLQPIFQGGRLRAQVRANVAAEDATMAQWAQSVLDAFADVETALAADTLLAARESHLANALDASTRAWRLAEDRYRQGIGNLLSVLEAQRGALNAESELIAVRSTRLQTRVDLHLALGGGFDATTGPTSDFLDPTNERPTDSPASE